jgi:hypothetical protein
VSLPFFNKKKIIFFLLLFPTLLFGQHLNFKNNPYTWPNAKPDLSKQTETFSEEDIVIIDEAVKLNLLDQSHKTLTKNCVLKINTIKGVSKLATLVLPESFDESFDKSLIQQGIHSKRESPFIFEVKIIYFAARVQKKNGTIRAINPTVDTRKIYWVAGNGNRLEDYNYNFHFNDLEVGDVVEYAYQVAYTGSYGGDLFYFNNTFAKQNSELEVAYFAVPQFESFDVICNINIPESCWIKKDTVIGINKTKWHYTYSFKNLKPLNYLSNICIGKELPHISIDLNFIRTATAGIGVKEQLLYANRGPHFEWKFLIFNSSNDPIYNKQFANVRKFISPLPAYHLKNPDFLYALNKNLNMLNYISAQSMNYSENSQYTVRSGEWLNKGKLIEEFMCELYAQILNEAKAPYDIICLQDKRLGEQKRNYRAEFKYEKSIFAIPIDKGLYYMLERVNGLKYYINELPFCYEGVMAVATYSNPTAEAIKKNDSTFIGGAFKFIKTHSSNENQNVRTENAVLKVNLDSSCITISIKENLGGQFSTIIRPFYLNDPIDSTVNPVYFKKCISKPNAYDVHVNPSSKSESSPFKYTFNCSEKIGMTSKNEIPLKDWFSFTYDKKTIPEKPNFDYFVDFRYTDMYNYMFEFNRETEILNVNDFTRSISNNYFELSSKLLKQTETSYLLSVIVKVKQPVIPLNEGETLVDFASNLEQLNNLVLKLK